MDWFAKLQKRKEIRDEIKKLQKEVSDYYHA